MGITHETIPPPQGAGFTFEKVWASFMELRESQKETDRQIKAMNAETAQEIKAMSAETDRQIKAMNAETAQEIKAMSAETDRQIKAMNAETDRMFKETTQEIKAMSAETDRMFKETDRQMKATDKRIGEITNRFGDMVEHMVVPNLVAKFQELAFTFTKVSRDMKIIDEHNRVLAEVDAFLENGDKVMVVEIKTKPDMSDIRDQGERMKKLRAYADARKDIRIYLGALAGVVISDPVKTYALKQGFYVLEPSGETFTITEPQAHGYSPREW